MGIPVDEQNTSFREMSYLRRLKVIKVGKRFYWKKAKDETMKYLWKNLWKAKEVEDPKKNIGKERKVYSTIQEVRSWDGITLPTAMLVVVHYNRCWSVLMSCA